MEGDSTLNLEFGACSVLHMCTTLEVESTLASVMMGDNGSPSPMK